jgi:hypothetical protein
MVRHLGRFGLSGILDQLDRAIGGLCPCGASPREGSAYCGDDCVPNWRGEHTTSEVDGTAMRWRPELLLADFDDDALVEIAHFPLGRNHATIYERTGTDRLHLRLDDGYRFVGTDVAPDQDGPADVEPGFRAELDPIWKRLERELGDADHLEDDPWGDLQTSWVGDWLSQWLPHESPDMPRLVRVAAEHQPQLVGSVYWAPAGTDPSGHESWRHLGTATNVAYAGEQVTFTVDNRVAVFRPRSS